MEHKKNQGVSNKGNSNATAAATGAAGIVAGAAGAFALHGGFTSATEPSGDDQHRTSYNFMGDDIPTDGPIAETGSGVGEIIQAEDGTVMEVASLEFADNKVVLADVDLDGTVDLVVADLNGDGNLTDDEFIDVSSRGFSMTDVAQYNSFNHPPEVGMDSCAIDPQSMSFIADSQMSFDDINPLGAADSFVDDTNVGGIV